MRTTKSIQALIKKKIAYEKIEREKQINSLLIGPEGGFSITEKNFLEKLNYIYGVSLGKRILRADTAAITALSLLIGEKYLKWKNL